MNVFTYNYIVIFFTCQLKNECIHFYYYAKSEILDYCTEHQNKRAESVLLILLSYLVLICDA